MVNKIPNTIDIAIINDRKEVQYYLHWIHMFGFVKINKKLYEKSIK